jgi:predicted MFS family arabinose efflux permease
MATSIFQLELGRFLLGLFSASAYVCCGKVARDLCDKKKYALLMGAATATGCVGGIIGGTPMAYLSSLVGWRNATFIIASIGLIIALFAFIFIPKDKEKTEITAKSFDLLFGLMTIIKKPKAWLLGFCGSVLYLPVSALAELWIIPFLETRFGISTKIASIGSITIFAGFSIGSIVSAWVAEKINSSKKVIVPSSILFIWTLWMALYSDATNYFWCLFFLLISSLLSSSNILAYAIVYSMVPEKYSGTSIGFMNAIIMSSGIIFQPLLGKLLDFFRNGMVNDAGQPVYTIVTYRSAFLFVIFGAILASIASFFVDDVKFSRKKV